MLDKLKPKGIISWDEQPEQVRDFWHKQLAVVNLPPLAIKVTQLDPDDPKFNIKTLIAQIGSDPVLAAKVLAVANSATMGQSNKITNTGRAVMQLGVALVQSIIVSYHMEGTLLEHPSFKQEHFEYIRKWSTLSSHIAYRIANSFGNLDGATICTAALLSRLSSLVLATINPAPEEEYWTQPNEVSRLLYEQAKWGISCPILSAHLIRLWGAPEPLPEMIETSWEPLFDGFKPQNSRVDETKVTIATSNALGAAFLSGSKGSALEILGRVAYVPLKKAIKTLGMVDLVMDLYSSSQMQRELKFRAK